MLSLICKIYNFSGWPYSIYNSNRWIRRVSQLLANLHGSSSLSNSNSKSLSLIVLSWPSKIQKVWAYILQFEITENEKIQIKLKPFWFNSWFSINSIILTFITFIYIRKLFELKMVMITHMFYINKIILMSWSDWITLNSI